MRHETLRYKMNAAIEHWLSTKDSSRFKRLMPTMKRQWARRAKAKGDYRDGSETYGYADAEFIENQMMYISDRWGCAFRLKWIIDGVEGEHI